MTTEHNLHVSSHEQKTGERESRLSKGTRKHIRRLKQEGSLKEAALIRNAAIEHKTR
jgi:hypothetical protein